MTEASPPSPLLGSFLVGTILSSIIFGAVTVQTKLYFSIFPKDSWLVKAMVVFLWCAQFTEVAIASRAAYGQTASHTGSPPTNPDLEPLQWEMQYWSTHLILTAFVVQSFYAYRLWALSRHRIYISFMASLIIVNVGLGFGDCFEIDDIHSNYVPASKGGGPVTSHHFPRVIALTLLSAITDLALACGVIVTLRKQRTGFDQTDRIVNWIILYGVTSGIATSIFAFVILIMNVVGDGPNAVGAGVPFGGVYIFSALAHLHSRSGLRSRLAAIPQKSWLTPRLGFAKTSAISASTANQSASSDPSMATDSYLRAEEASSSPGSDGIHVLRTIEMVADMDASPEGTDSHRRSPKQKHHANRQTSSSLHSVNDLVTRGLDLPSSGTASRPVVCISPPRFSPTALFAKGREAAVWE
ncbi:hypothetical protein DL93DRAFT_1591561 [Clavulina sp. PMI_390]|nr:hypothetical protein DL93DRAFT_1591561 [Clavulina sp. PMI_390]